MSQCPISPHRVLVAPRPDPSSGRRQAVDNTSQAVGADRFVQDSTRTVSLAYRDTHSAGKFMQVVAGLANGDGKIVDAVVTRSSADSAVKGAAAAEHARTLLRCAGTVIKAVGKGAEAASLPFAGLDVWSAVKAKPKQKNAAIATAALSVTGALAGVASVALLSTPAGVPLLIASAGIGAFQLLDSFVWKGKGAEWLGGHVVAPVRRWLGPL